MELLTTNIYIGDNPLDSKKCPTGISSNNPYIQWDLPVGITQRRFNVIITALSHPNSLIISGEKLSTDTFYQFPLGTGLIDHSWTGTCHVEIVIASDNILGNNFDYTTGNITLNPNACFVFDDFLEKFYSKNYLIFNWNKSIDPNLSQTITYDFQLASHPLFQEYNDECMIYNTTGITTDTDLVSYEIPTLPVNYYYWRVRSFDGIDHSDWTVANAIGIFDSEPPVVKILNVDQKYNSDGDIEIQFSLDTKTANFCSVFFQFCRIDDLLNSSPCRITNPLNSLVTGTYNVIWKSIRDIKKENVEIVLYIKAYNGSLYSDEDSYTFILLNLNVGQEQGGFTKPESFIFTGNLLNKTVSLEGVLGDYRNSGNVFVPQKYSYYGWNDLNPQQTIPLPLNSTEEEKTLWVSRNLAWRKNLVFNAFYKYTSDGFKNFMFYVQGRNITSSAPNEHPLTVSASPWQKPTDYDPVYYSGSGNYYSDDPLKFFGGKLEYIKEDGGNAPEFTLDPNIIDNTGYPIDAFKTNPNLYNEKISLDKVYVKKYLYTAAEQNADPVYGYKNFEVKQINGEYYREYFNRRGVGPVDPTNNLPITIAYPIYVPLNSVVSAPLGFNNGSLTYNIVNFAMGKWRYICGDATSTSVELENSTWTWNENTALLGTTRDKTGFIYSGEEKLKYIHPVYSDVAINPVYDASWFTYPGNVKPIEKIPYLDFSNISNISVEKKYYSDTSKKAKKEKNEGFPNLDFIYTGDYFDLPMKYFSGWSSELHPGYADREQPPYIYDQGFNLKGSFSEITPLTNLGIIYLQQIWDAYNTIHWEGTVSYTTKFNLKYCKYIDEINRTPWVDFITKETYYDETLGLNLLPPFTFSTFADTIDASNFEDGKTYRLLLSIYDTTTGTWAQAPVSDKFIISHEAINPANITSVVFSPWTKNAEIKFRIDDTQGDEYDLVGFFYSPDGSSFFPINLNDIKGNIKNLKSNSLINRQTGNIIENTILWDTTPYNLPPSNNYRLRIVTNLSVFSVGADKPLFAWTMNINPVINYALKNIKLLEGSEQQYVWNNDTGKYEKLLTPGFMTGKIEEYNNKIAALKVGIEVFYTDGDVTKTISDQQGYYNWLMEDVGGITRGELIQTYQKEVQFMTADVINYKKMIYREEITTRRNLIRDGFYCNGFCTMPVNMTVDEITGLPVVDTVLTLGGTDDFYFKVIQQPVGITISNGGYNSFYDTYYELQIDSSINFNSSNGSPLKTIYHDNNGLVLMAAVNNVSASYSNVNDGVFVNKEPVLTVSSPAQDNLNANSTTGNNVPATYSPTIVNGGGVIKESTSSCQCMLPLNQLPGTDGLYNWRVCAFNQFQNGENIEQPRVKLISKQIVGSKIEFTYNVMGNKNINYVGLYRQNHGLDPETDGYEISLGDKSRTWDLLDVELSFPTDITGPNPRVYDFPFIPFSTERERPNLLIDEENHEYYLFYHKPSIYDSITNANSVLMLAMGKDFKKFGEFSQCFPYFATDRLVDTYNFDSCKNPCVIKFQGNYIMYFAGIKNNVKNIYCTSSPDLELWETPVLITGSTGCDYPSVVTHGGAFLMFYVKNNQIYLKTSVNFIDFTNELLIYTNANNLTAPSFVSYGGKYLLFFTEEDENNNLKISSVTTNDFSVWENYTVELENAFNPCVVVDTYKSNQTLLLYYNKYDQTGAFIYTRVAVCNDKNWITHENDNFLIKPVNYENISCSPGGNLFSISIDPVNFGKTTGDINEIELMLKFENKNLLNWYKRKGTYVYPVNTTGEEFATNVPDGDIIMSPAHKFNYKTGANEIYYSLIKYLYSVNGNTGWHTVLTDNDVYYKISEDGGLNYGNSQRLTGR